MLAFIKSKASMWGDAPVAQVEEQRVSNPRVGGSIPSGRIFHRMKRPRFWLRWLLFTGLLLVIGEYIALTWLAPRYVILAIQRLAGGDVSVGEARLSLPLTTRLSGLRLVDNTAESGLSIQRVIIRPRWLSVPRRKLWVETLELQRPLLRLTRTKSGTVLWPSLPKSVLGASPNAPWWRIKINSINIMDGVLEFIDETPATPFHGVLDHLSIVIGPVSLPFRHAPVHPSHRSLKTAQTACSFAVSAEAAGYGGHAAPLYCSGWLDLANNNLEASCKLEPLALAALDPYFQGRVQVRPYDTTLKLTGEWVAKSNALEGRLQLSLDHLAQGDVSIHGTAIIDMKRLMAGQEPRMSAQIKLSGPLDQPKAWYAEFVPGDARAGQLVEPLREHGIERLKIRFGGQTVGLSLTPASTATTTSIEAASKEIEEALEILVPPKEVPEAVLAPPVETTAAQPAPMAPPAATSNETGTAIPPAPTPSASAPAPSENEAGSTSSAPPAPSPIQSNSGMTPASPTP